MNNFKISEFGTKRWYKDGELHREDGPAAEFSNGDKAWYKEGELHRANGPALEYYNGDKFWWINNKFIYKYISKNNILDKLYEETINKLFINAMKENIIYLRYKLNIINIKEILKQSR